MICCRTESGSYVSTEAGKLNALSKRGRGRNYRFNDGGLMRSNTNRAIIVFCAITVVMHRQHNTEVETDDQEATERKNPIRSDVLNCVETQISTHTPEFRPFTWFIVLFFLCPTRIDKPLLNAFACFSLSLSVRMSS
jgi:hypothetical protein